MQEGMCSRRYIKMSHENRKRFARNILVCSFVQIILGIDYSIDYEVLIQFSLAGITALYLWLCSFLYLITEEKAKGKYGMSV